MLGPNEFVFDSIGSRFWLERLDGGYFSTGLKDDILRYANEFDNAYSRFKDDSLVAQLARHGILHNPTPELVSMLEFSKQMYLASGGAFNITVGATLHKFGYGSRARGGELIADPWSEITWDAAKVVSPKGLMLDFGGFGKGWMIDTIAGILRAADINQFIVNGGGDLYVQNDSPVDFALENPQKPGTALRGVMLQKGALAGSDMVKRTWKDGKLTKHHIIDPDLQDSSNGGIIASYVIAETALLADTMATIMILRPSLKDELEAAYHFSSILITK